MLACICCQVSLPQSETEKSENRLPLQKQGRGALRVFGVLNLCWEVRTLVGLDISGNQIRLARASRPANAAETFYCHF